MNCGKPTATRSSAKVIRSQAVHGTQDDLGEGHGRFRDYDPSESGNGRTSALHSTGHQAEGGEIVPSPIEKSGDQVNSGPAIPCNILESLKKSWMQLLYGVPVLYTPGKVILIRNVGRAQGYVGAP